MGSNGERDTVDFAFYYTVEIATGNQWRMVEADGKFYFSTDRLNSVGPPGPWGGSIGSKIARCRRTGITESPQWTRSLQAKARHGCQPLWEQRIQPTNQKEALSNLVAHFPTNLTYCKLQVGF